MLAAIRHRGPDEFGIYLDDEVALGSARLSIVDLDGGQQPIGNEDGTIWVVFNGEIFNYLDFKPQLERAGHRFRTNTDTEVLIHLYEEYGPGFLNLLNGQFAFAIWDCHRRTLMLGRDRLGVRPLFYTSVQGSLVFGSEIKSILCDPRVKAEIDPEVMDQVFTFWGPLPSRTVFRNIHEVPPGTYLISGPGTMSIQQYWQLDFSPRAGAPRSAEEYLGELRELLTDATRIRLRADVPVGAYLSGGIDSSLVSAIIRNSGVSNLDTFSVSFADPDFDESAFQRTMAGFLGANHEVVRVTNADIADAIPEVIWHTEAPIMRTSPAPMFLLSRLVNAKGYKVVLTGEGADEFFGGYDLFKEAAIRRYWSRQPESHRRPQLLRRLYSDISALSKVDRSLLELFFGHDLSNTTCPHYSHAIRWRNNRRTRRFFSGDMLTVIDKEYPDPMESISYPPRFLTWDPLERAQYLESSIFLSGYLLSSQGDRMAMAHSVEGRYPFLDYRVVEFCGRLPARLKLNGLKEKYLLKKFARGMLPEEICRRTKRPYRAPIHRSFFSRSGTAGYIPELLSESSLRAAGLFNVPAVNALRRKLECGTAIGETDEMALIGIISSQLVVQHFISHFRSPQPIGGRDKVKICSGPKHQKAV